MPQLDPEIERLCLATMTILRSSHFPTYIATALCTLQQGRGSQNMAGKNATTESRDEATALYTRQLPYIYSTRGGDLNTSPGNATTHSS